MNTDKKNESPKIVEGEILDGGLDLKSNKKLGGKGKGLTKPFSRVPWILSGLLLVFISGLFMEPWLELGIERLLPGVLPPKQENKVVPDTRLGQNEQAIILLQRQLSQLKASIESQAQRSENTNNTLLKINEEITSLRGEVSNFKETATKNTPQSTSEHENNLDILNIFDERLLELETKLTGIQTGLSSSPSGDLGVGPSETSSQYIDQLGALEERLQTMEGRSYEDGKLNHLPIALANLARRVDGGQSFDQDLLNVRSNFESLTALDRARAQSHFDALSPLGSTGVASLDDLRVSFGGLISSTLRANSLPEDAGYWANTKNWFSSLVVIRKTGEVTGEDDEAIIARAEVSLVEKNLIKTITLVEGLSDPALEVLEPWLQEAKARIIALEAINSLIPIVFDEGGR
jgi:hypothetical protein